MPSETDYEISDAQIQASAARFLLDGREEDAASVLLLIFWSAMMANGAF